MFECLKAVWGQYIDLPVNRGCSFRYETCVHQPFKCGIEEFCFGIALAFCYGIFRGGVVFEVFENG
ncbi:hypothetical protein C4K00_2927 [Pseudomonas synxantha]|nr:hypothetical protein C4K00_2927 [Pseudomonas synxantha]